MEENRYRFSDGLRFLWPYIKQHKVAFILFYLGQLLISLGKIVITLKMGTMLDYAVYDQNINMFFQVGIQITGIHIVTWILQFGVYREHNQLMTSFARDIRQDVYRHYCYMTYEEYSKLEYGELLGDMDSYPEECVHFMVRGVCHQINRVIMLVFILISVIRIDLVLFVLFLVLSCVCVWRVQTNKSKIRKQSRAVQKEKAHFQSFITDILGGLEDINLLHARDYVAAKMRKVASKLYQAEGENLVHKVKIDNQLEALQVVVQLILYGYCVYLMWRSNTTIGTITVLLSFFSECKETMNMIYTNWYLAIMRLPYLQKIQNLLHTDTEKNEDGIHLADGELYDIQLQHVSFSYQNKMGEKEARRDNILVDLNLTIPKGETIGIEGKSGCGKSTMLSLLTRLNHPTQGKVLIGGFPIETVDLGSLRSHVGMLSQQTIIFDGTLQANLKIAKPTATNEEIETACRYAQLSDLVQRLPKGLDTYIGAKGIELSGGEKQRVSIARLYLKNPEIVLMDEPTASLDSTTQDNIISYWRHFFHDKTVIIVSHRDSLFQLCSHVFSLEKGEWIS